MPRAVEHGGGVSGKRGCPCGLCRAKKAEYERIRYGAPDTKPKTHWLTGEQVMAIKRDLYINELTQTAIARKYEVTQSFVSSIKRGRQWRSVKFHPTDADRRERDKLAQDRATARIAHRRAKKREANVKYWHGRGKELRQQRTGATPRTDKIAS